MSACRWFKENSCLIPRDAAQNDRQRLVKTMRVQVEMPIYSNRSTKGIVTIFHISSVGHTVCSMRFTPKKATAVIIKIK